MSGHLIYVLPEITISNIGTIYFYFELNQMWHKQVGLRIKIISILTLLYSVFLQLGVPILPNIDLFLFGTY